MITIWLNSGKGFSQLLTKPLKKTFLVDASGNRGEKDYSRSPLFYFWGAVGLWSVFGSHSIKSLGCT